MNKIAKTIASVGVAGVIGVGTYIGTTDNGKAVLPPFVVPTVNVPTVNVPEINLPNVNIFVSLPEIDLSVDVPSATQVELVNNEINTDINTPETTQIELVNNEINTPEVNNEINTPEVNKDINTPQSKTIIVKIPAVNGFYSITGVGISQNIDADAPEIEQIILSDPTERMPKVIAFYQKLKSIFKDQRGIDYDKTINYDNEDFKKWMDIYKDYKTIPAPAFIPVENLRMITEVKVPKSRENLDTLYENLAYYKRRGYTSALLTFDGSETVSNLVNTANIIKSRGFLPWFAYGGKETLHSTVFIDPDKYTACLTTLAKVCDGFLIGWRRTSQHLFEHDIEWDNYTVSTLRKANGKIKFLGEIYYGNTATNPHEHKWGLSANIPVNSSGVMINNFGFNGININGVINNFIPSKINIQAIPKVGVVVGDRAYYLIKNSRKLSQSQNQKIKEDLEKKFVSSGCIGTITHHDDGSDRVNGVTGSNNLSAVGYKAMGK